MGNATIIEANGYVPADLLLPVKDKSYVRYNRSLFLSFDTPHVLRVKALNPDGVYTAGDVISIECLFSAAVMVFYPPVLRLQVNIENRNAIFVSGNNSNTILFNFLIQPGDFSPRLDYVDTRLPPFSMTAYPANSLALNTDILGGSKERLQALYALQFNSIFIVPTVYGGVFTSSANTSSSSLTAANTFLPLPGDVNSISFLSNINIDTTAPVVVKVLDLFL